MRVLHCFFLSLAETLCQEALQQNARGYYNKPAPWAYYLERLYAETANDAKREELLRFILFHGDTSYFQKLKELYRQQGIWAGKKGSAITGVGQEADDT